MQMEIRKSYSANRLKHIKYMLFSRTSTVQHDSYRHGRVEHTVHALDSNTVLWAKCLLCCFCITGNQSIMCGGLRKSFKFWRFYYMVSQNCRFFFSFACNTIRSYSILKCGYPRKRIGRNSVFTDSNLISLIPRHPSYHYICSPSYYISLCLHTRSTQPLAADTPETRFILKTFCLPSSIQHV